MSEEVVDIELVPVGEALDAYVADHPESLEDYIAFKEVGLMCEELPVKSRHAFLAWCEGDTLKNIGEQLSGLSVERTRQVVHEAIRRIQKTALYVAVDRSDMIAVCDVCACRTPSMNALHAHKWREHIPERRAEADEQLHKWREHIARCIHGRL